jgi:SAM-dependent methyltransferase
MGDFFALSKRELKNYKEDEILEFSFEGQFPYTTRVFFVQHLLPYIIFKPFCKEKSILEIGVGKAFGSYYLSRFSRKVVGLDIDYSTRLYLKRYVLQNNIPNIDFINADAVHLPFCSESFDCIIACQVIEHIPEDKLNSFLNEIYRVLKREGHCLISTLNVEHNIKNPLKYEKFPQHHKEFNKTEFIELLNSVFASAEIFATGIGYKNRFFQRLKKWGFMKYNISNWNPVSNFYQNILPGDFVITKTISKRSIDLVGLCFKT